MVTKTSGEVQKRAALLVVVLHGVVDVMRQQLGEAFRRVVLYGIKRRCIHASGPRARVHLSSTIDQGIDADCMPVLDRKVDSTLPVRISRLFFPLATIIRVS